MTTTPQTPDDTRLLELLGDLLNERRHLHFLQREMVQQNLRLKTSTQRIDDLLAELNRGLGERELSSVVLDGLAETEKEDNAERS